MELTFNGHACVTLTDARGRVVVTDPYLPGALGGAIGHAPLLTRADVVTVSHWHVDHGHVTSALGAPQVVDRAQEAAGLTFRVRTTYHDRAGGTRMGLTRMVSFDLDGIRIAHLGDLGCDLTDADLAALGGVDVLLWPVGGKYTLGPEDAVHVLGVIRPKLAIPLHFKNVRCTLDLAPVEALVAAAPCPISRPGQSTWSSAAGVGDTTRILVLEPAL